MLCELILLKIGRRKLELARESAGTPAKPCSGSVALL